MLAGTFYLGLFITIFSVLLIVFVTTVALVMLALAYQPGRRDGALTKAGRGSAVRK
ncbi:hypothetical protein [Nesterenkonia sphaerica]|uniref:hypothetical protein n=1 Tax=Nesterenkonia sphaerica TaxID=1804988 RepID=UPI00140E3853|nr:hypothetical protein [Nesterenkonia sphaerica]